MYKYTLYCIQSQKKNSSCDRMLSQMEYEALDQPWIRSLRVLRPLKLVSGFESA